jgi:hypothetical protein
MAAFFSRIKDLRESTLQNHDSRALPEWFPRGKTRVRPRARAARDIARPFRLAREWGKANRVALA